MRHSPTTAKPVRPSAAPLGQRSYKDMLSGVVELLDTARRAAARSVNTLMTATYWEIGRRIVEHEQGGRRRAGYGEELIERLSVDLTARFGRGFGRRNLFLMRSFFLAFREKVQTLSALSPAAIHSTPSSKSPSPISQVLSEKSATPSRKSAEMSTLYATEGLPNQMVVREYLTVLPDEKLLAKEIEKIRKRLEERR